MKISSFGLFISFSVAMVVNINALFANDKNIESKNTDSKQTNIANIANADSKNINIESIKLASLDSIESIHANKDKTDSIKLADADSNTADSNTTESTPNAASSQSQSNVASQNAQSTGDIESKSDNNTESKNESTKTYILDKVVTTARGTEQLLKDAPASITVITREDLENKPHRDLAEALSDIPGVDISSEQGKVGGLKVTIRGLPSQYTLMLIDGKRQNPAGDMHTDNPGWAQTDYAFMPPLSAIERIEIIRGPASTLYGSDAIGGVINIITKKNIDKYGVSVGLETIQNEDRRFGGTYIANLFGTMPIIKNTLGLQLRGRYLFREPSDVKYTYIDLQGVTQVGTPRYTGSPTKAHIADFGGRILWNPDSKNHIYFDVQGGYQWYDNSKGQLGEVESYAANGTYRGPASNMPTYVVYRNNYILAHKGDYDNFSIENSLQFNQSWNLGRRISYISPINVGQNRDIQGKDVLLESKGFMDLPFDNFLSVGGSYYYTWFQDKIVANPFDNHIIALFAEDEWSIRDNLKLTLGVREDWSYRFGFHTSPKAYLMYEPLDDYLVLKSGFSMGYKNPGLNQLVEGVYGVNSTGTGARYGNPNLRPEQSWNYEFSLLSSNDYYDAGATYFYTFFWDKIDIKGLPNNQASAFCGVTSCSQAVNVDKSYLQGLELFLSLKNLYGFSLDTSYTYIDSKQLENSLTPSLKGYPLSDVLSHRVNAKLGYSMNFGKSQNLYIFVRGEWQGPRFRGWDPERNYRSIAVMGNYYKSFFLMDMGLTYRFNPKWKFNFGIYNLLNKDFADFREYINVNGRDTNRQNMYAVLYEGRRYWLSVNMDF